VRGPFGICTEWKLFEIDVEKFDVVRADQTSTTENSSKILINLERLIYCFVIQDGTKMDRLVRDALYGTM
jgi:hypothetical protein